jgi:DUF438 domain-containing protein
MNYELLYNDLKERFDAIVRKVEVTEAALGECHLSSEEYFVGQRVVYKKMVELFNDADYEHNRKVWEEEDMP